MHILKVDGRSYPLDQFKIELSSLNMIAWLAKQPTYPKVFWKEKETGTARAAIGNLLSFPHAPNLPLSNTADVRLYGGMRFEPKRKNDETWRGFPETCFWLPQVEVTQSEGKTEAIIQYLDDASHANAEQFDFTDSALEMPGHCIIDKQESPEYPEWQRNVDRVLEEIASGRLDKLVLARKTSLYFTQPVAVWPTLALLNQRATQSTVFAFQLSPSVAFIGATPEKFFHRQKELLTTDALAGTRPRGKTAQEDLRLERELLENLKEMREFKYVSEFLERALSPLSQKIEWLERDHVLKGTYVQHIHNRLKVWLKSEISDAELIKTLHPTPALGGIPRDSALSLLKTIEPFDRGWYGAPVGIIGTRESSLYVAIRSALIRERALHLFAGLGIVKGSTAEREWDELEQKIRPFTELFSIAK